MCLASAGAADDDEDDEDDDEEGDEVMEEKEDPEWSEEAITLVPYTLREQSRLKIMKDKYHVSVNLEDGGKKGGGQLTFSLTVGAGLLSFMLLLLRCFWRRRCCVWRVVFMGAVLVFTEAVMVFMEAVLTGACAQG